VSEIEVGTVSSRVCFVGTCGKPDVNAPDEGTWPTCSKYPPACVEHLAFVPPPQRKGVASSPAAPEVERLLERIWSELPLHMQARLIGEGVSLDPILLKLREAASSPAPPASQTIKILDRAEEGVAVSEHGDLPHRNSGDSSAPAKIAAFCRGVVRATTSYSDGWREVCQRLLDLETQRDELLAALKDANRTLNGCISACAQKHAIGVQSRPCLVCRLEVAIAKAEGR
jgi:hypothetical protein